MSKLSGAAVALISVGLFVGAIGLTTVGSYVHNANYGNSTEVAIDAAQQKAKNTLAQYGQKVQEAAQVPQQYAGDLDRIAKDTISGRYGADGSKAMFQMLKEQNINLDPSMYVQIQRIIESGRNDFKTAQDRQIDLVRSYKTNLGSVWSGFWLRSAGYPKINLKDYDIVSTDRADNAFATKKEAPIDVFGNKH